MELTNIEKQLSKEISSFIKDTETFGHISTPNKIDYSDFLKNKMLLVFAIRRGLPYSIFNLIQHHSPFSLNDWSGFLNISYKSLQRYKTNKTRFKPLYTEKIFELAEVLDTGIEIFGDLDKLKLWVTTENYSLGNLKPIELLRDSYGKDLVLAELTRIDHGILV